MVVKHTLTNSQKCLHCMLIVSYWSLCVHISFSDLDPFSRSWENLEMKQGCFFSCFICEFSEHFLCLIFQGFLQYRWTETFIFEMFRLRVSKMQVVFCFAFFQIFMSSFLPLYVHLKNKLFLFFSQIVVLYKLMILKRNPEKIMQFVPPHPTPPHPPSPPGLLSETF